MILYFLITSLVIYGIKASTDQGMILEPVYGLFIRLLSNFMGANGIIYLLKPLMRCTPCMASVWGSLSYVLYYPDPSVMSWLIWVFALAGFNYIVNKLLQR